MIEITGLHVVRTASGSIAAEWIDAVIRNDDRLRVLELGKDARAKILPVRRIALAGAQRLPVRRWPPGEQEMCASRPDSEML